MVKESFITFIHEDVKANPIALFQWMNTAKERMKINVEEFYNMPFFMFMQLYKMNLTEKERRSGRKVIVDSMRHTRKQFGWL